tara:strand:- start:84 stop:611 length:528 start_codon:yes stop_codon:yes gene_type:complete
MNGTQCLHKAIRSTRGKGLRVAMSLRPKPTSNVDVSALRTQLATCAAKARQWNLEATTRTSSRLYDSDAMSSDEEMEEEETEGQILRQKIENILDNMAGGNDLGWPNFGSQGELEEYILGLIMEYLDNATLEVENEAFLYARPALWQLARTRKLPKVQEWLTKREYDVAESSENA